MTEAAGPGRQAAGPRPGTDPVDPTFFGEHARFHHVGLGVRSIADACPNAEVVANATQGVSMAFIDLHGLRLELLEPLGEDSPIAKNLRDGVKLLHVCFEVPDVDAAVEAGRTAGFHRVSQSVTVPEYEDRTIAWVFSRTYGLVELLGQRPAPGSS